MTGAVEAGCHCVLAADALARRGELAALAAALAPRGMLLLEEPERVLDDPAARYRFPLSFCSRRDLEDFVTISNGRISLTL